MKRREYRIGPGAASLLLVVVVVSLSVLGLLALINARGDHKLTQRGMQFAASEYAASAQAERMLAELDGVLADCAQQAADDGEYMLLVSASLPEEMELDGRTVCWQLPSEYGRTLVCGVEIEPLGAQPRFAWTEHTFIADEGEPSFE